MYPGSLESHRGRRIGHFLRNDLAYGNNSAYRPYSSTAGRRGLQVTTWRVLYTNHSHGKITMTKSLARSSVLIDFQSRPL